MLVAIGFSGIAICAAGSAPLLGLYTTAPVVLRDRQQDALQQITELVMARTMEHRPQKTRMP